MAQQTLTTKNEEGDSQHLTVHLEDEHAEDEAETLHSLAEQAEQVPDLREELSAKEEELAAARDALVGEIVRRKKLAGKLEEDGVEDEKDFLSGLPMERLKTHYDRALNLEVHTGAATDLNAEADDTGDGNLYGEKGL